MENHQAISNQLNLLQKLPVEVLLYTFTFLSEKQLCILAKTSKWLKQHAFNPSLPPWRKANFARYRSKLNEENLIPIIRRINQVEIINFFTCRTITNTVLQTIAENCPKLISLKLFDNSGLLQVITTCPNLRRIQLVRCTKLTDAIIDAISRYLPNLDVLGIIFFPISSPNTLNNLISKCTNLTKLNISHIRSGYLSFGEISTYSTISKLVKLAVAYCNKDGNLLANQNLQKIANKCTNLESLDVSYCGLEVFSPALLDISKYCNRLRLLDLSGNQRVHNRIVEEIARNCTRLEIVNMEQCAKIQDSSIIAFALHCPNMKKMMMSGCQLLTDASISLIGKNNPLIRELGLSGIFGISDNCVEEICKNCPNMLHLNLAQCHQLTPISITNISSSLVLLKTLNVAQCKKIPPQSPEIVELKQKRPWLALKAGKSDLSL